MPFVSQRMFHKIESEVKNAVEFFPDPCCYSAYALDLNSSSHCELVRLCSASDNI